MQRVKDKLSGKAPVKWLFYGDSITHGVLHTFGTRDYTELFAERVRGEMGRAMDIVINTAINGNRTSELLEGFEWRVSPFKPDVVFLMIGMNDCSAQSGITATQFEANLHALSDRLEDLGSLPVLQTTCPILPGMAPEREPYFDAYMDAVRRVASEREVPLVDHARHWCEQAGGHFYWMSNAFHPNAHGHLAFARLLFRELGIEDPRSPCGRFFLP